MVRASIIDDEWDDATYPEASSGRYVQIRPRDSNRMSPRGSADLCQSQIVLIWMQLYKSSCEFWCDEKLCSVSWKCSCFYARKEIEERVLKWQMEGVIVCCRDAEVDGQLRAAAVVGAGGPPTLCPAEAWRHGCVCFFIFFSSLNSKRLKLLMVAEGRPRGGGRVRLGRPDVHHRPQPRGGALPVWRERQRLLRWWGRASAVAWRVTLSIFAIEFPPPIFFFKPLMFFQLFLGDFIKMKKNKPSYSTNRWQQRAYALKPITFVSKTRSFEWLNANELKRKTVILIVH